MHRVAEAGLGFARDYLALFQADTEARQAAISTRAFPGAMRTGLDRVKQQQGTMARSFRLLDDSAPPATIGNVTGITPVAYLASLDIARIEAVEAAVVAAVVSQTPLYLPFYRDKITLLQITAAWQRSPDAAGELRGDIEVQFQLQNTGPFSLTQYYTVSLLDALLLVSRRWGSCARRSRCCRGILAGMEEMGEGKGRYLLA